MKQTLEEKHEIYLRAFNVFERASSENIISLVPNQSGIQSKLIRIHIEVYFNWGLTLMVDHVTSLSKLNKFRNTQMIGLGNQVKVKNLFNYLVRNLIKQLKNLG